MKFWKPKYSVCEECKVHFEPASEAESEWGHLCPPHRKPVMERDLKRKAVMKWARQNWERVAEMMEKEIAAEHAAEVARNQSAYEQMARAQPRSGQLGGFGGLGTMGGT